MKITVTNEIGREVNPFNKTVIYSTGIEKPCAAYVAFEQSVTTYPAPGLKDGEYEAELVWQAWEGKVALRDCQWFDCRHPHEDYEKRGIDTRQIYRLSPSLKEAEVKQDGWIKCSDRLPETEVLLLTTSKKIVIGDWYKGIWRSAGQTYWINDPDNPPYQKLASNLKTEDVVQWMPLPSIAED